MNEFGLCVSCGSDTQSEARPSNEECCQDARLMDKELRLETNERNKKGRENTLYTNTCSESSANAVMLLYIFLHLQEHVIAD